MRLGHEVCSVPLVREELSAAIALANEARTLGELGQHDEEIMIYDRLASLFGNASEPALREQVAMALVNKGITFGQLGRLEDEIEAYDQVIARFGTPPSLRCASRSPWRSDIRALHRATLDDWKTKSRPATR